MKRQGHTFNNKRHVSPQLQSADCCGESSNDAGTLPSCSVASRGGEHPQIIKHMFFFGLESTQLACRHHFHRNIHGKKINKWSILTFFWPWPWRDPPPSTPLEGHCSCVSLRIWFWGGHLASLLDKLTWQAVTCQVIWRGAEGEGDKSTWQAQLVKLTCQVPLVLKRKCRTLEKVSRFSELS